MLVLRDVQQGIYLKKNMIYKDTDFDLVKRNIEQMSKEINSQMKNAQLNQVMSSETPPEETHGTPRHQTVRELGTYEDDNDTATEDLSMSVQRLNEGNYKSAKKAPAQEQYMSPTYQKSKAHR